MPAVNDDPRALPALFHWNTNRAPERQLDLARWFRELSPADQKNVLAIRNEGYDEGHASGLLYCYS